ncbi:hypothetical protein QBC44DRAFT_246473 [Cladorrhinum sp. PSN332]|nr:hypothetical protein QBC44DRAFT_246473 [Cladorrhinum sp. PSN332]
MPRKVVGVPRSASSRAASRRVISYAAPAKEPKSAPKGRSREDHTATVAATKAAAAAEDGQHELGEDESDLDIIGQFSYNKDAHGFKSLGSGSCTLISPPAPSQYPPATKTSLEVMTGTEGPKAGSIRITNAFSGESDHAIIPFANVEQVIVLPPEFARPPASKAKSEKFHRVIIVPTAATGFSALKRKLPQIISLNWHNRKADKQLKGQVGEAADKSTDTYLSVLKQVFDKQLQPFGKSVIDTTTDRDMQSVSGRLSATKRPFPVTFPPLCCNLSTFYCFNKAAVTGHVFFLEAGILFLSDKTGTRLFLPFTSFKQVLLILIEDLAGGQNGHTAVHLLIRKLTEPYFVQQGREDKEEPCINLGFKRVDIDLFEPLKTYFESHRAMVMEAEQTFYDYEANSPMTGWMPIKGGR